MSGGVELVQRLLSDHIDYGKRNVLESHQIEVRRSTGSRDTGLSAPMLPKIALKRAGTPDDVASPVKFLGSQRASHITGHVAVGWLAGGVHAEP
jgi:NAD(P)-dependent dehydrogenase (short-subunit alcohol dehydrogenase family)